MATVTERLLLLIDAKSEGATGEFDKTTAAIDRTGKAIDDTGKKAGGLGSALKSGLALGAGAVLGGGLADAILGIGKDFLEAARGAEMFANTTNSSVDEASRFMGMAKQMGLGLNDLIEIVAEFGPAAKAMGPELGKLGIEFQKNADGTTNMTLTLIDALAALQDIPDDVTRVQTAVKLFGEEGSKQLAQIYNGSRDVQDIFEEMTGLDLGDVQAAKDWDQAMRELGSSAREMGLSLAGTVLPAITSLVGVITPFVDLLSKVPPQLVLIGGGLLAFQAFTPGIGGVGAAFRGLGDDIAYQKALAAQSGIELTNLGAGLAAAEAGAKTLGSSLLNAFGGPVGLAVLGVGAAMAVADAATKAFDKTVHEALPGLNQLEEQLGDTEEAIRRTAEITDKNASVLARFRAASKVAEGPFVAVPELEAVADLIDAFKSGGESAQGFENELRKLRDEQGAAAAAAAALGVEQKTLNDLAAEGAIGTKEWNDAVAASAEQQTQQERNTRAVDEAVQRQMGTFSESEAQTKALTEERKRLADQIALGTTSGAAFEASLARVAQGEASTTAQQDLLTASVAAYRAQTDLAVQSTLDAVSAQYSVNDAFRTAQDALQTARTAQDDVKTASDEVAAANDNAMQAVMAFAQGTMDAATQQAALRGEVLSTAQQADVYIQALQTMAAEPGVSDEQKANIQALIDQITTAKAKGTEGVAIGVTATGQDAAAGSIDDAAAPRTSEVTVESRGGPAVKAYLDDVAAERLSLVNVESRGGPAVISYLDGIASKSRLAMIQVESRNGPAVIAYLDSIADKDRLAIIRVETRGGPAVDTYLNQLANQRTVTLRAPSRAAPAAASGAALSAFNRAAPVGVSTMVGGASTRALATAAGGTVVANTYHIAVDVAPNHNPAEVGRSLVNAIRRFEATAGAGWRR